MNRRLHKKTHRAKLTEWGCRLQATRTTKANAQAFQDAFILEAIERNGCVCGGCLSEDKVDVMVELGRLSGGAKNKLAGVIAWLDGRKDIRSWKAGPLFCLRQRDSRDITERGAPAAASVTRTATGHARRMVQARRPAAKRLTHWQTSALMAYRKGFISQGKLAELVAVPVVGVSKWLAGQSLQVSMPYDPEDDANA